MRTGTYVLLTFFLSVCDFASVFFITASVYLLISQFLACVKDSRLSGLNHLGSVGLCENYEIWKLF